MHLEVLQDLHIILGRVRCIQMFYRIYCILGRDRCILKFYTIFRYRINWHIVHQKKHAFWSSTRSSGIEEIDILFARRNMHFHSFIHSYQLYSELNCVQSITILYTNTVYKIFWYIHRYIIRFLGGTCKGRFLIFFIF